MRGVPGFSVWSMSPRLRQPHCFRPHPANVWSHALVNARAREPSEKLRRRARERHARRIGSLRCMRMPSSPGMATHLALRSRPSCTALFASSSSPSSPAHEPENSQPHDSSSRSFMPSCAAASSRTVSCAFIATTVVTTVWCPSRASAVASAPRAAAAAWPTPPLTSWTASSPRCPSASGCSRSHAYFAALCVRRKAHERSASRVSPSALRGAAAPRFLVLPPPSHDEVGRVLAGTSTAPGAKPGQWERSRSVPWPLVSHRSTARSQRHKSHHNRRPACCRPWSRVE